MPLAFPNVAVLGTTQDSRFFEAGFEYASFRRISIQGLVTDLTETFGITGVWNGQQGILNTISNIYNYQDLYINGHSFGSGRLESISFDAGNDVRTKGYQASLLIYNSGNLFNFTGLYYSGIDISNFQYLQSFQEDYSFDHKLNGGYSYTHNANIQFISGCIGLNAIEAAQAVARTLFTGSNLGFAFYPGYTNKQGKRYFTEVYNTLNNDCVFQERFDFDADDGDYSAIYTTAVQLDERGVVTTTEQGIIRGITNPNYQNALSAIATQLTGSYYRCSGASSYYFSGSSLLKRSPITQGRIIDIFDNNIGYTVVFDNNPNNSGIYFWNYTQETARQDGIGTITEQGEVIGRGENTIIAFNNAQNGFVGIKAGISGRMSSLFSSTFGSYSGFLQNKQEGYAPVQSRVNYSQQYSNDPTLVSNTGIRRIVVTDNTNKSVYIYNKINIVNYAEIAQDDFQSTPQSTTMTVALEGDKTVGLTQFLAAAVAQINSRIPIGNDRFIGDCSYSFAPNDNTSNVNLTWIYNKGAVKTIYP